MVLTAFRAASPHGLPRWGRNGSAGRACARGGSRLPSALRGRSGTAYWPDGGKFTPESFVGGRAARQAQACGTTLGTCRSRGTGALGAGRKASAWLPAFPLSRKSASLRTPTHAAASANACRRIRQRMPLHLPTHAAASANAAHCIRQRMPPHLPTQRTASSALPWSGGRGGLLHVPAGRAPPLRGDITTDFPAVTRSHGEGHRFQPLGK